MITKKILIILSGFMLTNFMAGCSDDNQSNDWITGTWELKTICFPEFPESNCEMPPDSRDVFIFSLNGKVKVFLKRDFKCGDLPNKDGEYDYSYSKEKQEIQLCGETLKCVVSDSEMSMIGQDFGADDGLYSHEYIFIRTRDQ